MALESFATLEDYELRYGAADDSARITALLADASAYILGCPGFVLNEDDEVQAANLVRITCNIVKRTQSASELAGLSSYSQGAGDYSATVNVYNPGEVFFLTKAEKRVLGIFGSRVGAISPAVHSPSGGVVWP